MFFQKLAFYYNLSQRLSSEKTLIFFEKLSTTDVITLYVYILIIHYFGI